MNVIKRDGRVVNFDDSKIQTAIARALRDAYPEVDSADAINAIAETYADDVLTLIQNEEDKNSVTVEHIQDVVEEVLQNDDKVCAQCYHEYRFKRACVRDAKSPVNK